MGLARTFMNEARDKETFARQHALETGKQTTAGIGLHGDAVAHIGHGPGFGPNPFARVQFDFNQLHFIADDFIIDDICHGRSFFAVRLPKQVPVPFWQAAPCCSVFFT